ncbi:hypothetical protein [Allocoleopsis sp.]
MDLRFWIDLGDRSIWLMLGESDRVENGKVLWVFRRALFASQMR